MVTVGIMHVDSTASLMAAPRSDVVTTFEVVQAAAIDPGTLGRAYGLFDFDFLEARNIFFFKSFTDENDGWRFFLYQS